MSKYIMKLLMPSLNILHNQFLNPVSITKNLELFMPLEVCLEKLKLARFAPHSVFESSQNKELDFKFKIIASFQEKKFETLQTKARAKVRISKI